MAARVLVVSGSSWLSRLIQLGCRSQWSHCAFAFSEPSGDWHTVEADQDPTAPAGQVLSRSLADYPWKYEAYSIVGLTETKESDLRKWCDAQIGRQYDLGKALGLGLWLFFGITGFRSILDRSDHFLCFELIWEGCETIGLSLETDQAWGLPRDLPNDNRLFLDPIKLT